MTPVALTIAGSDPSGGAGLQADLKTFHRFGVYGEAVVTLITVQNTQSVARVEVLAADLVRQQIEAVFRDVPPQAAKTGALGSREVVEAVCEAALLCPLVVDPVILSSRGTPLLDEAGRRALADRLVPRAFLIIPNLAEAEALSGVPARDVTSMRRAAEALASRGARNVLIKGGHLTGDAVDVLLTEDGRLQEFTAPRIDIRHTHGTGCAYSAAITAGLALGQPLQEAVARAKEFITGAIQTAPGLGGGAGPLNL